MTMPSVVTVTPRTGARRHPILFVHGAWHGAWCWSRFQPWFAEQGWETHAIDLRGHGETPNDRSIRLTRVRHYIEDVATVVEAMDRPPILVGHAMGGLIVQRYLEYEELPGAVLVAPVPMGGVMRATMRVARRHPIKFLKANMTMSLGPFVEDLEVAAGLFLREDADPSEIAWLGERLQVESYLAYLDMMFFVRARPQLVHTPVSYVIASEDALFSVKELTKSARVYGNESDVVEGAPHDVMLGSTWEAGAKAVARAAEEF